MKNQIESLLNPKSVAIVGASLTESSVGFVVLKNIKESSFEGEIYPINPKYVNGMGLKFYPSILDTPEIPDLAVIVINSKLVLDAIEECHKRGIRGVYIISAGFKEAGHDGAELEKQLSNKLKEYGIRAIGPNGIGILNNCPENKINASFADNNTTFGKTAYISQSGALGCGVLNMLSDMGLGLAYMVSLGNQCDITTTELIEYFGDNKNVDQILLYIETIKDADKFKEACQKVSKTKPIICVKSGRSDKGAVATTSHTGSLAGSEIVTEAFLKQCGVLRQISLSDMLTTSFAVSKTCVPAGNKTVIMTNGAGPAILAVDKLVDLGIEPIKIPDNLIETLKTFNSPLASYNNPIDMIASATPEVYQKTLDECLKHSEVDIVLLIHLELLGYKSEDIAKSTMTVAKKYPKKTVLSVYITPEQNFDRIIKSNPTMPVYKTVDEAAHAIKQLLRYKNCREADIKPLSGIKLDKAKIKAILDGAKKENRTLLTTHESLEIFKACGLNVCKSMLATTEAEAIKLANEIGYPVVLKASSKVMTHKSDVGAVKVNIKNDDELKKNYSQIIKSLSEHGYSEGLEGILVQQMIKHDKAFVVGLSTDPLYGKVSMFGFGGVYVEVFKDVCFKTLPLTTEDLHEQLYTPKSSKLLMGARGGVKAKMEQIEKALAAVSELSQAFPSIQESDINPLVIEEATGNAVVVDARFVNS
ncbi:MAG: acetate--CoA ligase family protein [Christensenellaceae bacterium]|nr:acetate--CoA ligase family protein [Christensenellaceae bacterium]